MDEPESDLKEWAGRLHELEQRLAQGRFHLAVLGQFKRGKSTLLNALLGEKILPVAVVPLTAIPTFILPGAERGVRVLFQDGRPPEKRFGMDAETLRDFLSRFVTEEENPSNMLGVQQVDVMHPAAILRGGTVLIDTPGVGSTFRHNTEATLNFLPQCDAGLFLVSADPPITEVELEFLRQVRKKIPRLFFVLNKVDYLNPEEQREALDFLRKVLKEKAEIEENIPVFCISAKKGLEAKEQADDARWEKSGLAEVERRLIDFLIHEKGGALRDALRGKAADLVGDALMRLRLEIRCLQLPREELRDRVASFEKKLNEIQQQRQAASDLLAGDLKRTHEYLEIYAEELRVRAREYFEGMVMEVLAGANADDINEQMIREKLAEAIPGYFERQSGETAEHFHKRMAETLKPHQKRADELIEFIRRTASDLFEVPYHAPESDQAFEMVRKPFWITHKWASTFNPIPRGLLDRLLPSGVRRRRIQQFWTEQIDSLVLSNVENLRWATFQSIDATFRRFGSKLDERLADTTAATHGAIQTAMERRQKESAEATPRETRLSKTANKLVLIEKALRT